MNTIDINCDLGESFGNYTVGRDEEILEFVTSANIACGFHAGDPTTMRKTVQLALEKNVGIGAHPGFQDLLGFGRRNIEMSPSEVYDMVLYQIGALSAFVKAEGGRLQHVKPHGALYNMAAKDKNLANAIAEAIYNVDSSLVLFGLAGSELLKAGKELGLMTASEVFADRTYQDDGSLTSRSESHALITNHEEAVQQVITMIKNRTVKSIRGINIRITADTVCIHGDGKHALQFAEYIHKALIEANITIQKIGHA